LSEEEKEAPATELSSEESAGGDLIFDTLWKRTLEAWEDDKPHTAVLDYAMRTEHLPTLAGAYRSLLNDEAKKERAQEKLDALVAAATTLLMARKAPPRTKAPWQMTLLIAMVCVFSIGWLAAKIWEMRR